MTKDEVIAKIMEYFKLYGAYIPESAVFRNTEKGLKKLSSAEVGSLNVMLVGLRRRNGNV